jgi:hypothetical protein
MRYVLVIVVFILSGFAVTAQKELKLAKKYLADYKGVIPAYILPSSGGEVRVNETPIEVTINESTIELTIGQLRRKDNYVILFESKGYFLLECKVENEPVAERIVVYKRGKKIGRDGLYPQPTAILFKQKS